MSVNLSKRPVFWVDWADPRNPAIRLWGKEAVGIPITFGSAKELVRVNMGRGYRGPWIRRGVAKLRIRDIIQQERLRMGGPEQIRALLSEPFPVRKKKPQPKLYLCMGRKGPAWSFQYDRKG